MKKNLLFLVALLVSAIANAVVIDGIAYSLNGSKKTASVVKNGYTGDITIPTTVVDDNGVTYVVNEIGKEAFYNSTVTSVCLPNSIEIIGDHAFAGCKSLSSINIPDNLTTIGGSAFCDCSSLNIPIYLPDQTTSVGTYAFAFSGITKFSTSCPVIENWALAQCYSLTEVIFRDGTKKINVCALYDNDSLKTLVLPKTLTSIQSHAFEQTFIALKDIYLLTSHLPNKFGSYEADGSIKVWGGSSPAGHATLHVLNSTIIEEIKADTWDWGLFQNIVIMGKNKLTYYVDAEEYKSYELYYGDAITPEPCPQKEGYTFSGWSELPATMPFADYDVYGYFIVNHHQLTYYVDGEIYQSYEVDYGTTITPEPLPQKEGYTFSGWSEIPATMPDNDYEVYGHFIEIGFDNHIVVNNSEVFCGTTSNLNINLQNDGTDLTAYQFDLTLPSGFDIAKNKKGKPDVILSDRYENDDHSLSVEELGNGKYRFVCVSLTNSTIEGTEGPLMTLALQVASDVAEGSYIANVENIVLTHVDGTKQKVDPVSFTLTVSTYIRGDANGDLEIDVADVVAIVNYILEKPGADFVLKAADADEDGEVDVADAVKVVSMIMAQVSNNAPQKRIKKMKQAQAQAGDGLYVDDFSIDEGEKVQMSLKLKNAIDYCSFQCDLFLPDGLTIALNKKGKPDVKLDDDRIDDHTLSLEHASNGSYRLVCTSLSNAAFYENDGPIVNIMVEPVAEFPSGIQEGHIENVRLVEPNGTKHKDFATSTFKVSFGTATHVDVVKTNMSYDVYNLQGVKVRENGSSTVLPKGLYIMNGEKVFVK